MYKKIIETLKKHLHNSSWFLSKVEKTELNLRYRTHFFYKQENKYLYQRFHVMPLLYLK